MSYGKNCLISNIEENVQVCEDNALTFEKSNVVDLTNKLKDALQCKNRKKSEELQDYILSKYSWTDVTDMTENLYYKILKEG